MTEEEGQVSSETDPASETPPAEIPGAEAPKAQEVPPEQPVEQPIEDPESSEQMVPMKRLQGLQRYHSAQEKEWKNAQSAWTQERDEMRSRLKVIETQDMTDAERQNYESREVAREERQGRLEAEKRLAEVAKGQEMNDFRQYVAAEWGVPWKELAPLNDFWDMMDLAKTYALGQRPSPQEQPPQAPPLGPETKVQTAEGARAPTKEFDEFQSGEKSLREFGAYRRKTKRAGGEIT